VGGALTDAEVHVIGSLFISRRGEAEAARIASAFVG